MELLREIMAGIVGGAIFVYFFFVFPHDPLYIVLSLALMVAAYQAARRILGTDIAKTLLITAGIDRASRRELKALIEEGFAKLSIIQRLASDLTNPQLRRQTEEICELIKTILDYVKTHPLKARAVRDFFEFHLDEVIGILTQYNKVAPLASHNADVQEVMKETEEKFTILHKNFHQQLNELAEGELFDLRVELAKVEVRNERGL